MLISIIIATYNSGKTLSRCLDSILSQLDEDCETLIIDGGSKDETQNIVKLYGEKIAYFISEPDKGVYDAWNKGIKHARGKWITFIGSDDIMLPNTIKLYKSFFATHGEDYDLVSGKIHFVDKNGNVIRDFGEPWNWEKHIYRKLNLAHPGMLHNRRLFDRIGFFDLRYKICSDSDFLQRVGPEAKGGFINDYLVNMSQGGLSDGYAAMKEGYLSRKNNKCIPPFINILQHIRILFSYYAGRVKRFLLSFWGK
ncbi:MAG: glycosyltransferase [Bacteroidaceae bacterium]|nr:glycosyltransferase [Bacteroidaceae bacterium]